MRNWLAEMFQGFLETPHTIGIDFRTGTRLLDCQNWGNTINFYDQFTDL
jgi:hypothetical protein